MVSDKERIKELEEENRKLRAQIKKDKYDLGIKVSKKRELKGKDGELGMSNQINNLVEWRKLHKTNPEKLRSILFWSVKNKYTTIAKVGRELGLKRETTRDFVNGITKSVPRALKNKPELIRKLNRDYGIKLRRKDAARRKVEDRFPQRIYVEGYDVHGVKRRLSKTYTNPYERELVLKKAIELFYGEEYNGVEITSIQFAQLKLDVPKEKRKWEIRKWGEGVPLKKKEDQLPLFTFDVETLPNGDYVIGSVWGRDDDGNKELKIRTYDRRELFRYMMQNPAKYHAHNSGGFDVYYLLPDFFDAWHSGYKFKILDNRLGKIVVKNPSDELVSVIVDTYRIMPHSLENIAEDFGIIPKDDEVKDDDVIIKEVNLKVKEFRFCKLNRADTNEILKIVGLVEKYVDVDCVILLEALENFHEMLDLMNEELNTFAKFKNKYTAPNVTMNLFKEFYGKKKFREDLTINKFYDEFIRESYYGGRTEMFETHGYNLAYYDVNSLYPSVMSNYDFGYGKVYETNEYQKGKIGYYKVRITSNSKVDRNFIPSTPVRTKLGLRYVVLPVGHVITYTSVDLDYMLERGIRI